MQKMPEQDHESAIRQREIGADHRVAISFILLQSGKTGARWRDDQPAVCDGLIDRFRNIAIKETDAEELLGRGHATSCSRDR